MYATAASTARASRETLRVRDAANLALPVLKAAAKQRCSDSRLKTPRGAFFHLHLVYCREMKRQTLFWGTIAFVIVGVLVSFAAQYFLPCFEVPERDPVEGSQGYRIWTGETLRSFEHFGRAICVPEGWQALGAQEVKDGTARFPKNKTGIFIRPEAFHAELLRPEHSSYEITLLYPTSASPAFARAYADITENAFTRTGKLFGDSRTNTPRAHTVLVTAGLAGDTIEDGTRVYPDPTGAVSVFVRTPNHSRAEELVIHAVMHLYNRERTDLTGYQTEQEPFPAEDFQELEATWAESAFMRNSENRLARIHYMHTVHVAVRTGDTSALTEPRFTDAEEIASMHESAVVPPGSSWLEYQYGHYILAPLAMLAIDGLLRERNTDVRIETLLTDIHTGAKRNFMGALTEVLSPDDMAYLEKWFFGEESVPLHLVLNALRSY